MTYSGVVSYNEGKRIGYDLLLPGVVSKDEARVPVMTCCGVVSKNEVKRTGYDLLRCDVMREKGEDEVGVGLHKLVALLAYLPRTNLSFLTHLTQEKR